MGVLEGACVGTSLHVKFSSDGQVCARGSATHHWYSACRNAFRRQQDDVGEKHPPGEVPLAAGASHEAQVSQADAPGPENWLAGHGEHVAAAASEKVPAGHIWHGCPAEAYEPAAHGVQEDEKAAE